MLAEDRAALPAHSTDTAVFYSISNCHKGLAGVSFGSFLIKQVASDLNVDLERDRAEQPAEVTRQGAQ